MRRRAPSLASGPALALLLAASSAAQAGSILRRSVQSGQPATPATPESLLEAAAQKNDALRRGLDAIRAFQAAQSAARTAAQQAVSSVPDGLGIGGLQLDPLLATVGAGAPTQTIAANGQTEVNITQTDQRAILNWTAFNIGKLTDVHFDQSAGGANVASWVALNRVTDPNAAPSQILGSITAQGQVYLLNRNGVLFGGSSQINVGSLVVAALNLTSDFKLTPLYNLAFADDKPGAVSVEPGASISAAPFGRVVLLGGSVQNAGTIEAPDGQVFLAAGSQIHLDPSDSLSAVRGLQPPRNDYSPVLTGDGVATNLGLISAPRGNITLVAGQTLQQGVLTATTGAQADGSIFVGMDGAHTEFGPGSTTQVLPDFGGKKVIGAGTDFQASKIQVLGDHVEVLGDATLYAPGGSILFNAKMTALPQCPSGPCADPTGLITDPTLLDDTRIYLESGARLDVSGLRDVAVSMESNSLVAELRANELRDNPVVRDGALRSRSVYFDLRLGGGLQDGTGVANLGGYYNLLQRDVSQLMTLGGRIQLAANQVIVRQGSVIDLSGGSERYADGYVRSSVLIDQAGNRVPIEEALAGTLYLGIDGDAISSHPRWGLSETFSSQFSHAHLEFETGYLQGGAAGQLSFGTTVPLWYQNLSVPNDTRPPPLPSATGAVLILDGTLVANTVTGTRQRQLPTAAGATDPTQAWRQEPLGASLLIDGAGDVRFAAGGALLPSSFGRSSAVDPSLFHKDVLPARWFDGTLVKNLSINAGFDPDDIPHPDTSTHPQAVDNRAPGGNLVVDAGAIVNLGDGGTFNFKGKSAEIDGAILAPGGSVSLNATQSAPAGVAAPLATTIHLGASGAIDVAGRFTNDALDGLDGPVRASTGGAVTLTAPIISLDAGSSIDVSGGGRLNAAGTRLSGGAAGAITLDVSRPPSPTPNDQPNPYPGTLQLGGNLFGYSLTSGGSLTVKTGDDISISADAPLFNPRFFTVGGFASYSLNARNITVAGGTTLAPSVLGFALSPVEARELPTGARLAEVNPLPVADASGNQLPMSLSLSAESISVEKGAAVAMSPGSNLTLAAQSDLQVDGRLSSSGGLLSLATSSAAGGGITLGADAQLLAPGYQASLYAGGSLIRSVAAGGTVSIASASGLQIDRSALIDVSGISGISTQLVDAGRSADNSPYVDKQVSGSAGSLTIQAATGQVSGVFRLGPADSSGRGGSLVISTRNPGNALIVGPTAAAGQLTVSAGSIDGSGADDVTLRTPGSLGAGSLDNGSPILFDAGSGSVELHARGSITLETPSLGLTPNSTAAARVTLSAEYVALIGGQSVGPLKVDHGLMRGELDVNAGVIDVARTVVLGCALATGLSPCSGEAAFGSAVFSATGDLRLSDHDPLGRDLSIGVPTSAYPGLFSAGPLTLQAQQVYVASRGRLESAYSLTGLERAPADPGFLVESDAFIRVERPAGASDSDVPPAPLSFGERLTLRAPEIQQGGVLRAPLGQIRLEGVDDAGNPTGVVDLLKGSVTSVALPAGTVVPFGLVQSGGGFLGYTQPGAAPTKSVLVSGATISLEPGSVVDVSGGADLLGYSQFPGNGGSYDVMGLYGSGGVADPVNGRFGAPSLGKNLPAPFAVLPGWGSALAPLGPVASLNDPRLHVGDQVWLQGVAGLAAGWYTLLPAHYALLGGYLVQQLPGSYASAPGSFQRSDGAVVTGGERGITLLADPSYSASSLRLVDQSFSRFAVLSPYVFGRYSEIVPYSFDVAAHNLASDAGLSVRTPFDAGSVVLEATGQLSLLGTGRFGAPQGGLSGLLDISAPRIAVVSQATAGQLSLTDYLKLDAKALADFGAGSVLLGGTRTASTDPARPGTVVTVNASSVVVDTGGQAWTGSEMLLTATGDVTIRDGSVLQATGTAATDAGSLLLSGNGALVRLSSGGRVGLVRTGSDGKSGTLDVGNATLSASGSLALEGSETVSLAPTGSCTGQGGCLSLSTPQLDLASDQVSLGDAPAGTAGTVLGAGLITQLASQSDLLVRGQNSVHLYGSLDLGGSGAGATAALPGITFDTPLLEGDGAASISLTVGRLTLRNSGAPDAAGPPAAGTGTLQIAADSLLLGPGEMEVAGFGQIAGSAGSILVTDQGANGSRSQSGLSVSGDLSLATAQVSATSGSSYTVATTGTATLGHASASVAAPDSLGGRLVIKGNGGVVIDTLIALPGGSVEADSSGGDVRLLSNAAIDVSGRAIDFRGQTRFAPGGVIRLSAANSVAIASGASLDVSGSAAGGDAGGLALSAGGVVAVDGSLLGSAMAGFQGGSFSVEGAQVGEGPVLDLAAFDAKLEVKKSGFGVSFDTARIFDVRAQDILLAAGSRIAAHQVVLRSENGKVTVDGVIDASGDAVHADGGRIDLLGNDVSLTGTLDAHAWAGSLQKGGFSPASGTVLLAAASGKVEVAPSARIDLSGGKGDGLNQSGGSLVVQAPRTGSDLAVSLGGTVVGERQVIVQGVSTYDLPAGTILDAAMLQELKLIADAAAWLQNAGAISARLTGANPSLAVKVGAGILLRGAGDLTLKDNLSLNGALGAGFVGLTAKGNLNILAALSDGFDDAAALAAGKGIREAGLLLPGAGLERDSSSFLLEAKGTLTLTDATVRTGTGSITIRAGLDLLLDPNAQHPSSVIYTAGRATAPAGLSIPGARVGDFPVDGGDLDIEVGRDIRAPVPDETTSAWLFRYGSTSWGAVNAPVNTSVGTVAQQTSWSIVFSNFQEGLGALGGGNVQVSAGNDIAQLQISLPTTGQLTTPLGGHPQIGDLITLGGGDLRLLAGDDVLGGLFVLGRGHAELGAAGSFAPDAGRVALRTNPGGGALSPSPLGLLIGLADASASVTAGTDIYLEGVFDPMRQGQVQANLLQVNGSGPHVLGSAFWGYTGRTALDATSVGGSTRYQNDPWASTDLSNSNASFRVVMRDTDPSALNSLFSRAPPTLRFNSLSGDVAVEDHFSSASTLQIASAPSGTLEILAARNANVRVDVREEEYAAIYSPGPLTPFSTVRDASGIDRAQIGTGLSDNTNYQRGKTGAPLHLLDTQPARIYALSGSVCFSRDLTYCVRGTVPLTDLVVVLPKPLEVYAGLDIIRGFLQPENNSAADISSLTAGRDLYQPLVMATGPGTLLLQAGRDVIITQGYSASAPLQGGAVYSLGNESVSPPNSGGGNPSLKAPANLIVNPLLPAGKAADIVIVAGASSAPDADRNALAFAHAYLDPANPVQRAVHDYLPQLRAFMDALDAKYGAYSDADLVAAFAALPLTRRQILLEQIYFTELKETGIDYNDAQGPRFHSYDRGFQAVSLLFPQAPGSSRSGGILLSGKPVETRADAGITLLAPHGSVQVGTSIVPSFYPEGSLGGVITRRGGDIRIMADQDIALYTSRVFTLQGGDITLWTSNGSISAGSGSKTSVQQPPLAYVISSEGAISVDAFGLSTGAGIGVLDALENAEGRPPSRLDIIAPRGEVNAGDAGIRVVGNINIAAAVVVGVENIQVSGAATGVPKVEAPNLGALTSASQVAQAAAQQGVGQDAVPHNTVAELPSIITVEVVGYETPDDSDGKDSKRKKSKAGTAPAPQAAPQR